MSKIVKNELLKYRKLSRQRWEDENREYEEQVKNNELTDKEKEQKKLALIASAPTPILSSDDYSDEFIDLEEFPREAFNVFSNDSLDDDQQAFNAMKNLEELANIEELQDIKMLGIHDSFLEDHDMAPLSVLKNLQEIDFFGDQDGGIKTKFFSSKALPNIKILKSIDIHDLNFFRSFPNVESLVIKFYTHFHGEEFKIKTCDLSFLANLKELILICPDQEVLSCVAKISNLSSLHILSHSDPEPKFDLTEFRNLSKLETLSLCSSIVDVRELINLPNLSSIQTDYFACLKNLEVLDKNKIKVNLMSNEDIDKIFYNFVQSEF